MRLNEKCYLYDVGKRAIVKVGDALAKLGLRINHRNEAFRLRPSSVYGQRVKQEAIKAKFGVSLGNGRSPRPPRFAPHLPLRPKTRRRPAGYAVGRDLVGR